MKTEKNTFGKSYFERYAEGNRESERFLQGVIQQLPQDGKVLDVGCGKGTFLREVHEQRPDLELHAADVGAVEEYLPEYVHFRKESGDDLSYEEGTFDLIVCMHVLEHVPNPHDFMSEYARTLKKGGRVYVESPYYKKMFIPDGKMNFWSDPTHIRPYNVVSMRRLFEENGLETQEVIVWRNWLSVLIGPYLLAKRLFLGDRDAASTFFAHLCGNAIGGLGTK